MQKLTIFHYWTFYSTYEIVNITMRNYTAEFPMFFNFLLKSSFLSHWGVHPYL